MALFTLPHGVFSSRITLEIVRPPAFARYQESGAIYLIGRNYELAYRAVLRFTNGTDFQINAKLFGDINRQVVICDAQGRPARVSGYTQGRCEISDADGTLIFEGHYYDSRIHQELTGDNALTPTGTRTVDHWENAFGRGAFVAHAFSLGVRLEREGDVLGGGTPLSGEAKGQID
jgi:hypothetical protein